MKKLSDYEGNEAIELWADLLDPLTVIINDKGLRRIVQSGQSKLDIAKQILKSHSKEAVQILQRIDPEPVNGLNIVLRLVTVLSEIGENEGIKSFFGYAEQEKTESASSGLRMESTEEEEN